MRRYRWLIILLLLIGTVVVVAGYAAAPAARRVLVARVEAPAGTCFLLSVIERLYVCNYDQERCTKFHYKPR